MPQLLEVWNDTVDSKHLVAGIGIGIGIAVPSYLLADYLFSNNGNDSSLAHSYALLVGIMGCIVGAVITGILFKPKRVISVSSADNRNQQEIIDEVVAEYGDLGDPRDLPSSVQAEVRSLGLFDALVENHEKRMTEAGG